MKTKSETNHLRKLLGAPLACLVAAFSMSFTIAADTEKKELDAEEVSVVEDGTYRVTAHIVDDEEKELYVKMEDGRILELYLKSDTTMMRGDEKVEFTEFEKGQTLEIEVKKDGDHMKPVSVKIVEE